MKYVFLKRTILLGLLAWLAVSCCEPCEKENLGDFSLKEEVKDWLLFGGSTQSYKSNTNNTVVITFQEAENGFIPQLDNCEEVNRCGLCCEEFNVEYQRVIGTDPNLLFTFEIVVIKDFFKHNPSEGNENISEYLEIRMNNQGDYTCRLENLAEAELVDVVTLNGTTYSNVFKCEVDPGTLVIDDAQITGIYFTKAIGIIGWRVGEDEVYGLI